MKQRQEGTLEGKEEEEIDGKEKGGKVKLARPVEGDDVPRPGRVRFGPPAGAAAGEAEDEDEGDGGQEINPSAGLENHLSEEIDDGRELDEEQEEPKIEGEGADADTDEDEDAYFDSYLSKRISSLGCCG